MTVQSAPTSLVLLLVACPTVAPMPAPHVAPSSQPPAPAALATPYAIEQAPFAELQVLQTGDCDLSVRSEPALAEHEQAAMEVSVFSIDAGGASPRTGATRFRANSRESQRVFFDGMANGSYVCLTDYRNTDAELVGSAVTSIKIPLRAASVDCTAWRTTTLDRGAGDILLSVSDLCQSPVRGITVHAVSSGAQDAALDVRAVEDGVYVVAGGPWREHTEQLQISCDGYVSACVELRRDLQRNAFVAATLRANSSITLEAVVPTTQDRPLSLYLLHDKTKCVLWRVISTTGLQTIAGVPAGTYSIVVLGDACGGIGTVTVAQQQDARASVALNRPIAVVRLNANEQVTIQARIAEASSGEMLVALPTARRTSAEYRFPAGDYLVELAWREGGVERSRTVPLRLLGGEVATLDREYALR